MNSTEPKYIVRTWDDTGKEDRKGGRFFYFDESFKTLEEARDADCSLYPTIMKRQLIRKTGDREEIVETTRNPNYSPKFAKEQ